MSRQTLVAMLFVISASTHAQESDLIGRSAVLRMFWHLLQNANYGYGNLEQAAFIVRTPRNELACLLWPSSPEPHTGRWAGPFPPGTIAIIHTHPNRTPHPSRTDIRTADSAGVPVYVITRRAIYKAWGNKAELVARDWDPGLSSIIPPCRNAQTFRERRSLQTRLSTSNDTVVAASQTMPAEIPPAMSESQCTPR